MPLSVVEPLFPDADEAFDGDLPSPEETAHHEEVERLIWAFAKLALPDTDLLFQGRLAINGFCSRKSKLHLHPADRDQMIDAVGQARRAVENSTVGWRLRYLTKGFNAIVVEILLWANVDDYRETIDRDELFDHQDYLQCLRNEIRTADLVFAIRQRRAAKTVRTLQSMTKRTALAVPQDAGTANAERL
ncbi:hypothetical protein [Mesorhizobium sp. B2-3-4]|uniref:hypothetical protein n=1 Tax=Mesorhizobium sp. B2-3-4 TaxID=2589959 RepID=UPI0011276F53|nr:hypothetical protein [Mesorhizobium sp. B2-3-4]TPM31461.1 hypothetical protein FJ967_24790 [Mesorhizobium sp. B2-3-4]